MKINYNVTGAERKSLVAAISQTLNTPAKYLGMPTAAYEAGGYNIDKTGTLTGPDNRELVSDLQELHGFKAASEEYDAPKNRKGIMDILVDELNANETDGGHWERLHSTPQMECGDGRWRNLDGTFAVTTLTENRADEDLDYGEAQHYPGRYANPDAPITEEMQNQLDEYAATVTDDHGGEYDENGKYIQGTGEAVCFPEDGMSADDVPTMITIELPATNVKEDILRALIESKATLINAALGEDGFGELPIEFDSGEGKVAFNWLRFGASADTIKAWSTFLAAAVKFSKTAKRVTAKDTAVENEKFAFRAFMVKIGMNGVEDKWARKFLLRSLTGDSAFATPESKAKWLAKHGSKKAETE